MPRIDFAKGFRLDAPGVFSVVTLPVLTPARHEVVVEVAGCGLCHTDVGFASGNVPTRHPLPLILGHEVSGRVVDAGEGSEAWIGRSVIVPAVIPCGRCDACDAGRPTICRKQFMPGNDGHGGFATHIVVPSRGLCAVPDQLPDGLTLPMLSVVADAVTTPFAAMIRASVGPDDLAVIVGVGGIGGFAVQIAVACGATAVAIDVDDDRLFLAQLHGASLTLNPNQVDARALKSSIRGLVRERGCGRVGTKIFEMSGTAAGQKTAFGLLDFGSQLAVVGYTPDPVEVRLSNLMAFDAVARGNWGCAPANYPQALDLVLRGRVKLAPFIEVHALDELPDLFDAASRHALHRRAIIVPPAGQRQVISSEFERITA